MDEIKKAEFSQVTEEKNANSVQLNPADKLGKILDVELEAAVELGRTKLTIEQSLEIDVGSVIELDKTAGEPVSFYINDNLFGKGEVVVVGDRYGIRITELVPNKETNGKKL